MAKIIYLFELREKRDKKLQLKDILENDTTPEQSHENWLKQKLEEGWVYGKEKNVELKTHPCMKRYEELPKYQRAKDSLFKSICDCFK